MMIIVARSLLWPKEGATGIAGRRSAVRRRVRGGQKRHNSDRNNGRTAIAILRAHHVDVEQFELENVFIRELVCDGDRMAVVVWIAEEDVVLAIKGNCLAQRVASWSGTSRAAPTAEGTADGILG